MNSQVYGGIEQVDVKVSVLQLQEEPEVTAAKGSNSRFNTVSLMSVKDHGPGYTGLLLSS